MVYTIFVRKKNGHVIHEKYRKRLQAILRYDELCEKFPEVSLDKDNYKNCCKTIKVI